MVSIKINKKNNKAQVWINYEKKIPHIPAIKINCVYFSLRNWWHLSDDDGTFKRSNIYKNKQQYQSSFHTVITKQINPKGIQYAAVAVPATALLSPLHNSNHSVILL